MNYARQCRLVLPRVGHRSQSGGECAMPFMCSCLDVEHVTSLRPPFSYLPGRLVLRLCCIVVRCRQRVSHGNTIVTATHHKQTHAGQPTTRMAMAVACNIDREYPPIKNIYKEYLMEIFFLFLLFFMNASPLCTMFMNGL